MPRKPLRPCRYPGCPRLSDGSYCEEHRAKETQTYNRYLRDPDTYRRYGRAWKKIRERFLAVHPLCEQCKAEGRLEPAMEVHHVLPLADGGTNDAHNLMALCKRCHSRITLDANRNFGQHGGTSKE